MLLLGSVFDANSLGKWIYDWTVFHQGAGAPISDMAGELWLLLIQFSAHRKEVAEKVNLVRDAGKREVVGEFVASSGRIQSKLRSLLRLCEEPMLRAGEPESESLGAESGVEFVKTLFGRDKELARTERFMQSVRLFNFRFESNCAEILDELAAATG